MLVGWLLILSKAIFSTPPPPLPFNFLAECSLGENNEYFLYARLDLCISCTLGISSI